MRAMVVEHPGRAARRARAPRPGARAGQVLVRVLACGVCRTDLHVADGELPQPGPAGRPRARDRRRGGALRRAGDAVRAGRPRRRRLARVDLRLVPLLRRPGARTSATQARFTGLAARRRLRRVRRRGRALRVPAPRRDRSRRRPRRSCARGSSGTAPGGWRATRRGLGIYGFGAAGHIVAQVARHAGQEVFAFTRPGDDGRAGARARASAPRGPAAPTRPRPRRSTPPSSSRRSARSSPPRSRPSRPGGTVVCAGIHMSDIPVLPLRAPLGRAGRSARSRTSRARDGEAFLALAPRVPRALRGDALPARARERGARRAPRGALEGAAVMVPGGGG